MKQCLALVGVIFLMGAILHEKKLPAATINSHLTTPELTFARMEMPHPATNSGFLDNINLSYDPGVEIHNPDPQSASRSLQTDIPAGSFDRLPPRTGPATKPGLTVADRRLNYQLLDSGGFAFKLNLTPAYSNPEAAIPNALDPGFGIIIKF